MEEEEEEEEEEEGAEEAASLSTSDETQQPPSPGAGGFVGRQPCGFALPPPARRGVRGSPPCSLPRPPDPLSQDRADGWPGAGCVSLSRPRGQSSSGGRREALTASPRAGGAPPGVDPEAFSWFQAVDADRSGSISAKELKQALVNSNWSTFNDETCLLMISESGRSLPSPSLRRGEALRSHGPEQPPGKRSPERDRAAPSTVLVGDTSRDP